MHYPDSDHEGSHDLSHTFKEMATSPGFLGSDVHEGQHIRTGQKDLWVTHHAAKSSPKSIHFFWVVPPSESPKIMGLKEIHSSKALRWWSGLSFCLCCGKEEQNESTVVNHLRTSHYHSGLVCGWCLEYFMTSANTMHHHSQLCKPAPAGIKKDSIWFSCGSLWFLEFLMDEVRQWSHPNIGGRGPTTIGWEYSTSR